MMPCRAIRIFTRAKSGVFFWIAAVRETNLLRALSRREQLYVQRSVSVLELRMRQDTTKMIGRFSFKESSNEFKTALAGLHLLHC